MMAERIVKETEEETAPRPEERPEPAEWGTPEGTHVGDT